MPRPITLVALSVALLCLPALVHADYLGGITFDHPTPAYLDHGTVVNISIDYKLDDPAGGVIFARPFTNGSPTPAYAASGGDVVAAGTGTVNQSFRITSGNHTVTHVRVYMRDRDLTETWLELFVPVHFEYGPHGIFNIQPDRSEYSRLRHGNRLYVDFDYATGGAGCKIYARPFTDGHLTPGYAASGSADLPPAGSYSQYFSFDADADVTHIRLRMYALDNTTLLKEIFIPYDIHWREHGIFNIALDAEPLDAIHNSENLTAGFVLDHGGAGDLYVWVWSIVDGGYAPGSVYQGSVPEAPGAHLVTRYTRVASGEIDLDAVRFLVGTPSEILMEFDVPLPVHYGPHAVRNAAFTPASPAIMTNGEQLQMTYDYWTDDAAGVRIFARGAFDGVPLFGQSNPGLPILPPPSGSSSFWITYGSVFREANAIRFQVWDVDQSVIHLEHFVPGMWIWGDSAVVTDAPDPAMAAAVMLAPNHPNPFNPTTTIPVTLGRETHVKLAVYDLRGRLVRSLQDGRLPAGEHAFTLRGEGLTSGAYICRLETPQGVQTRSMTLIK